jgi:hypothetical protein
MYEQPPFFNQDTRWMAMEKGIIKSGQEPNGIKLVKSHFPIDS